MNSTKQKQLAELKSNIVYPLVLFGAAWVVFFVLSCVNGQKEGMSVWQILAIEVPVAVVVTAVALSFYLPVFKCYLALKALPDDPPVRQQSIHVAKVKFLHNGGMRHSTRRFCGVIFMDDQGNKYTYILEETLWKDKENCAPYVAHKGHTITLFCYGDSRYVEKIRG